MSEYYESISYTPPPRPEPRQRQQINDAVNAAMRATNAQHMRDMAAMRKKHEEEIAKLNRELSKLDNELSNTTRIRQKQLIKMRQEYDEQLKQAMSEAEAKRQQDKRQFEKELNDAIDTVNDNVEQLRKSTQKAFDATRKSMENLRKETEKAFREQQKQIDDIVKEVHDDKKKALAVKNRLYKECQSLCSLIRTSNYQKYAPGRLDEIEKRINEIDSLPVDSACAILHTKHRDLQVLQEEIVLAQMKYEARHDATLRAANSVLNSMKEQRETLTFTDGRNNVATKKNGDVDKVDLDFWSDEKFGKLELELSAVRDAIVQGIDNPQYSVATLDAMLQEIRDVDRRQQELVDESIRRGNSSRIRKGMATKIKRHLKMQEFNVVAEGYENGDERNAYFIKLEKKINGTKLVIIINPTSYENNQIVIGTVESDLYEGALIRQGEDINDVLEKAGIEINRKTCQKSNQTFDGLYDFDIARKKIPEEMKMSAGIK